MAILLRLVYGLGILPLRDRAVLQADVVLFAGVLHDHVIRRLQVPRPHVHPILCSPFKLRRLFSTLTGVKRM